MIVLIAAAIAGGLATAAILAPVSSLAALILVPLAASASAIFAGISIAWRGAHEDTDRHGGRARSDGMAVAPVRIHR
ncbi:hypothetical protein [Methylobacterium fujisawaense]|uniref:hypothetical protein n=1 Tax=Methylobacterium fujisawaense TaxID=107400 RepID=UPI0036FFE7AA